MYIFNYYELVCIYKEVITLYLFLGRGNIENTMLKTIFFYLLYNAYLSLLVTRTFGANAKEEEFLK